jgi:exosortase/archaeosortase family protein
MQLNQNICNKNAPYLFLFKFLAVFFSLYFFFPLYRGIIGPGGKMYSPYFENHFNIVTSLTRLLTSSARLLLEGAGFNIIQRDYHSFKIGYSKGITVNPSCLGWAVMSFWVAFVSANKGVLSHKLKWILVGLTSVVLLNITRIALIAIANHSNWHTITSLDHHQTFNVASYVCIAILIGWYISVQKKYERIKPAGEVGKIIGIR